MYIIPYTGCIHPPTPTALSSSRLDDRNREFVRASTGVEGLDEILGDRYLINRTTPSQRARLLDRPEVVRAIGDDTIADARRALST